jgi:hypothetical protein
MSGFTDFAEENGQLSVEISMTYQYTFELPYFSHGILSHPNAGCQCK